MSVPARVSLATLGVTDLARSTAFYQALGWPLSSDSVPGTISFFRTAGGILALFPAHRLAGDAGAEAAPVAGFRGVSLAINLEGPDEVDAAMAEALQAGGRVLKHPVAAEWGGYSGYFADPDGHTWEVAYNPAWPIGADGRPALPE